MRAVPIEIYCVNCGHQLAYLTVSRGESIVKWSNILKKYKYRCPVCMHKLDPSELTLSGVSKTVRVVRTWELKRKTVPKPWNRRGILTWRPWRP